MIDLAGSSKALGRKIVRVDPVPIEWHDGLSIFASEPFLKSVGSEYGWLGGFDSRDKLRCVLPYTIVASAFLRMVRFRVETIPMNGALGIDEEKAFLNRAMGHFRAIGADLVIPATTSTIFRTFPEGADAAPYGTYVIDLLSTEEAIWNGVKSSHRRQIKTARKNRIEVADCAGDLGLVYSLVRDTFQRSRMPFMELAPFRRMIEGLGDNVRIMTASHNGVVQAGVVIPYSSFAAYYVYGGTVPEPATGAMHLLHWEAMCALRRKGVERYDFVGVRIAPEPGTKQDGLKTFKERFGGKLVDGYMWKYPFRRLRYELYCKAAQFRKGGDIVDQERHKLARFQAGGQSSLERGENSLPNS